MTNPKLLHSAFRTGKQHGNFPAMGVDVDTNEEYTTTQVKGDALINSVSIVLNNAATSQLYLQYMQYIHEKKSNYSLIY